MAGLEVLPEVHLEYLTYLSNFLKPLDPSALPPAGQSSASGRWFLFQRLPPTGSPSGSSPGSGHQGRGPAFPFQFRLPTLILVIFHAGSTPPQPRHAHFFRKDCLHPWFPWLAWLKGGFFLGPLPCSLSACLHLSPVDHSAPPHFLSPSSYSCSLLSAPLLPLGGSP